VSPDCIKPNGNPQWQFYHRHRGVSCAQWDQELPHKASARPKGLAKYNPYFYACDTSISALEIDCWNNGIDIPGKNAAYKHMGHIVGVCRGQETEYAFAECTSGFVHGRPVSKDALKDMGIHAP